MLEYNIEEFDFEKQKNELKEFAEQAETDIEFDKFDTKGRWSDFLSGGIPSLLSGHKVTGEELNNLVTKLQSCFIEINERDMKVIKEFGQVYETFEALDKGYIQGILIGVKSAEKASQEAKEAQKDIDATIKILQRTIDKLKEFKDEVKGYNHLKDIDEIWNYYHHLDNYLEDIARQISELNLFKAKIEGCMQIDDIDSTLDFVYDMGKNIKKSNDNNSVIGDKLGSHEERRQLHENKDSKFKYRLNIACIIAGSALGVSVIQMILLLTGVL